MVEITIHAILLPKNPSVTMPLTFKPVTLIIAVASGVNHGPGNWW